MQELGVSILRAEPIAPRVVGAAHPSAPFAAEKHFLRNSGGPVATVMQASESRPGMPSFQCRELLTKS